MNVKFAHDKDFAQTSEFEWSMPRRKEQPWKWRAGARIDVVQSEPSAVM